MKRLLIPSIILLAFLLSTLSASHLKGDFDGDGTVSFADFLFFAQNFGKSVDDPNAHGTSGEDTIRVTVHDTIQITVADTIRTTVTDTARITVADTVRVTFTDTVQITQTVTNTVTNTVSILPNGETVSPTSLQGEITIASFNIRIFSTGSRDDSELSQIADRLAQFDLIAIQELRDSEVIDRTLAILASRGLTYQAIVSDAVGRTSSTERYTFLWRSDRINMQGSPHIWDDEGDVFIREPFIASFKASNFDFTLISIHVIFGNRVADRWQRSPI